MLSVNQVSIENRLRNVSIEMKAGQCWHVLGQNGAGKSSLFDLIAGLEKPESGQLMLHSQDMSLMPIADIATKLVYLQQHYTLSFALTVSEVLSFYSGSSQVPDEIDRSLSIRPLLSRTINTLSGGEQQRVHIARCLMQTWSTIEQGQALVLLDEPIQSLDVISQERALSLFQRLAKKGNLVLLSIHDINLSVRYADHVFMMKNQTKLYFGETHKVMTASHISELYDFPFSELQNQNNSEKFFIRTPL